MEPATDLAIGNGLGVKMFLLFGASPKVAEYCKTTMADSN